MTKEEQKLRGKIAELRCSLGCELWWGGECHSSILPKERTCGNWLADQILIPIKEVCYLKAERELPEVPRYDNRGNKVQMPNQ